ncbi:MAG: Glu-tRNA(Gln) amidotransferase subunit GatE [Bradymonadales bacterium]|nr:Glu-tRNA(Gln) amidotransferase subunit GatE [Bradymonadales bacterium]
MTIPPYGTLSPDDYRALGFRSGLEVHQQLFTQNKLFCRCPAGRYSPVYHAEILRHMRPTLSELGEYDGTALMEFKTKKEIIYRLHRDTVCTYEMDDAPPFLLDDEALDHALEIAHLLNCNIVGELHITRKQYLDGSIPTGFQRTTIVGTDGYILVGGRRIGVRQLGLEEDACREVSDEGHVRTYLTDRLSMPLVEVVTEPELTTPEEVAQANQVIRFLTRSSGKVRTGAGAGRQDVNVSVAGGTRVEIKGVCRIPLIPALVHYEAFRQVTLLRLRDGLLAAGLSPDTFHPRHKEVTRAVYRATYPPLRAALDQGARVRAVVLPGFGDAMNTMTQPGRPFSSEVSDRVRVIACLDRLPNLIYRHMPDPGLDPSIWSRVLPAMAAEEGDGLVLVWGNEQDVRTAAEEIGIRCAEALVGIPSETRQVLGDGTAGVTGFERILPGPDRMYPDTDLPPIPIPDDRVEKARLRVDAPPWELGERYRAMGVPEHLVDRLILSPRRRLFEQAIKSFPGISTARVAHLLTATLTGWRRRSGIPVDRVSDEQMLDLIRLLHKGRLQYESLKEVVRYLAAHEQVSADIALRDLGIQPAGEVEVRDLVAQVLDQEGGGLQMDRRRWKALMGKVMARVRGRYPGRGVAAILEEMTGGLHARASAAGEEGDR